MEKILVVDDSKITQMLVSDILKEKYRLVFRDNGAEGVEAALSEAPDLILLDIALPDMLGYDVCRQLKSVKSTEDIPIIFITSKDSEVERVKGFAAGAEDYVVKPFYLEELLARVRVHLAVRKARDQAIELERLNLFKEMAVALSHEINNPLTTIYAYLHMMQKEFPPLSGGMGQSFAGITKELDKIKQITAKLSQASRISKTQYSRDVTMLDLHNI